MIITMENDHNNSTLFVPREMPSPFDAIKEMDGESHECWNPRKLAQWLEYIPQNGSI